MTEIKALPEPLDIRLESGLRVRDLMTVEACDLELRCLERDRDLIYGQSRPTRPRPNAGRLAGEHARRWPCDGRSAP